MRRFRDDLRRNLKLRPTKFLDLERMPVASACDRAICRKIDTRLAKVSVVRQLKFEIEGAEIVQVTGPFAISLLRESLTENVSPLALSPRPSTSPSLPAVIVRI